MFEKRKAEHVNELKRQVEYSITRLIEMDARTQF